MSIVHRPVILSIDIGLLNLALCIVEKRPVLKEPTVSMHVWSLLNTLNDTSQTAPLSIVYCSQDVAGRGCKRKAQWRHPRQELYYCTQHKPPDTELKELKRTKKKTSVKNMSNQTITWKLLCILDQFCEANKELLSRVTTVVIEKQPLENRKMQLTSTVVFSHFVRYFTNTVPVVLLPAYHKLSMYDGPEIVCNLKTLYAKRKFESVEHTKWFLNNRVVDSAPLIKFLDGHKKKDDLCDAFLQGLYYLSTKGTNSAKTSSSTFTQRGGRRRRKKLHF